MKNVNNRIIVRVNMAQKDTIKIGDIVVKTAPLFDSNFREKSPVIAEVVNGNYKLKPGQIIITHHNHFYTPSPYHLEEDLFSIPYNKQIFGVLDDKGDLSPVNGNIFGNRVEIPSVIPLPPELRKKYVDRITVTDARGTKYKRGETVFHRLNAGYDIVYVYAGVEKRVTKVIDEMVVGVLTEAK